LTSVEKIRADFPILKEKIRNKPLVYLDNAASCQKPQQVIDSIVHCYSHEYANVHRGVHTLSVRATDRYEGAREKVKDFINAQSTKEIIFVRGATEAINLIAQTFGKANIKAGDEILITAMEHHSNIVPWQMLCEGTGAVLSYLLPPDKEASLLIKLAYHKAHQYLKGHIIYVQKTHKNHNPKPVHRQTYVESLAHHPIKQGYFLLLQQQ
jgi:cysteine desulfurase/selenocysteine lyase